MRTKHSNNRPPFVVDASSIIRTQGRQPNFDKTGERFKYGAIKLVVAVAGALANAVLIPIKTATTKALPVGTVLSFGGKKFARLSQNEPAGVSSLHVEAIPTALVENDTAYAGGTGNKRIPAGTALAEDSTGKIFPRADVGGGTETCYGFAETDITENVPTDAETGFGVIRGGNLFENMLPDAIANGGTLPAGYKTELKANDAQFMFDTYADSRGA